MKYREIAGPYFVNLGLIVILSGIFYIKVIEIVILGVLLQIIALAIIASKFGRKGNVS